MLEIPQQHREIFPYTESQTLKRFYFHLEQLEIHDACGMRPCRMCIVNGKRGNGTSMPNETVCRLFTQIDTYAPGKQVNLFYRGEPMYFQRKHLTIADILAWGINNTSLSFYFRTHGHLYTDGDNLIPQKAMQTLAVLLGNPDFERAVYWERIKIGYSTDPWGPVGTYNETDPNDFETHKQRVYRNLLEWVPIKILLSAGIFYFYNINDRDGFGSKRKVIQFAREVKPIELGNIKETLIETYRAPKSRSSHIQPILPLINPGNPEPWRGYGIKVNGDIVCSTDDVPPFKIGSIYEPLSVHTLPPISNSIGV